MTWGNAGSRGEAGLMPVVEKIGKSEREVLLIFGEHPGDGRGYVLLGGRLAEFRVKRAQSVEAALADDTIGLLGDDAEMATDFTLFVEKRTVGERVVGLFAIAAALEE